ncbi:hypothetical protein [Flavitalea sp.]|nr:hypothetical protein [Flavitalea sp.]
MSAIVRSGSSSAEQARQVITQQEKIIELDNNLHFSNQERTPVGVMLLLLF